MKRFRVDTMIEPMLTLLGVMILWIAVAVFIRFTVVLNIWKCNGWSLCLLLSPLFPRHAAFCLLWMMALVYSYRPGAEFRLLMHIIGVSRIWRKTGRCYGTEQGNFGCYPEWCGRTTLPERKVPALSYFDKANIIQRRLNVTFPNFFRYARRPFLWLEPRLLGSSLGIKKQSRVICTYLPLFLLRMYLPGSWRPLLMLICRLSGMACCPLDRRRWLMRWLKIAQKRGGSGGARWSILISQHRGGGLRLIVVRNSELALTALRLLLSLILILRVLGRQMCRRNCKLLWAICPVLVILRKMVWILSLLETHTYTEPPPAMIFAPCNYTVLTLREAASYVGVNVPKMKMVIIRTFCMRVGCP